MRRTVNFFLIAFFHLIITVVRTNIRCTRGLYIIINPLFFLPIVIYGRSTRTYDYYLLFETNNNNKKNI